MAFDKNSNSFTFIFAIILVCVVGTALAVAFLGLKPEYTENVRREKMQNILAAMNVKVARDDAPAKFTEYVSGSLLVDANGKVVDGSARDKASDKSEASPAFSLDVLKQFKDWKAGVVKPETMHYPVYQATVEGHDLMVVPLMGTGLWGPVWGYLAIDKADGRTVYGSTFDHKGETPGLGAEISTPIFIDQFPGKTITEPDGTYTGIKVYKGGSMTTDPHGVDGISGGTITSQGVDEMLMRTLAIYDTYFKTITKKEPVVEVQVSVVDTVSTNAMEIQ